MKQPDCTFSSIFAIHCLHFVQERRLRSTLDSNPTEIGDCQQNPSFATQLKRHKISYSELFKSQIQRIQLIGLRDSMCVALF
jgi:hypothetical protein